MRPLVLRNGALHAEILPTFGAALARLDYLGAAGPLPLLRPYAGQTPPRPNQMACFPLVPWSNRMAGGFSFAGEQHAIAPNRDDDPYPMHGHGWQRPWEVLEASSTHAVLAFACAAAPFTYLAQLTYSLEGQALVVTLAVTNQGERALPFGLGLHPWMARTPGTTLQAGAHQVWLAGADRLPKRAAAIPTAWSFATARGLPVEAIDNVFEGWDGTAHIAWPEHGLSLALVSDYRYYIVYAPPGKDFFCLEPVDHRIDAHNGEGGPERHGLSVLAPGETLERVCRFEAGVIGVGGEVLGGAAYCAKA